MSRIIETTIYQFDELSDAAKEKAREWFRNLRDGSDFDFVIEDAVRMGEMLGIDFDTREVTLMGGGKRQDPIVYWSLAYSQSDHAAFEGRYTYKPDAYKAISDETGGTETVLRRIAVELDALNKELGDTLTGRITYHHYYGLRVECEAFSDDDAETEITPMQGARFNQTMKDFAGWIYSQLRAEDEWQSADEQVDDSIRANEYEFTADGKIV